MSKKPTEQEIVARIRRMLKAQKRALENLQREANRKRYRQTMQRHSDIRRKSLRSVKNVHDPLLTNASVPILVKNK